MFRAPRRLYGALAGAAIQGDMRRSAQGKLGGGRGPAGGGGGGGGAPVTASMHAGAAASSLLRAAPQAAAPGASVGRTHISERYRGVACRCNTWHPHGQQGSPARACCSQWLSAGQLPLGGKHCPLLALIHQRYAQHANMLCAMQCCAAEAAARHDEAARQPPARPRR